MAADEKENEPYHLKFPELSIILNFILSLGISITVLLGVRGLEWLVHLLKPVNNPGTEFQSYLSSDIDVTRFLTTSTDIVVITMVSIVGIFSILRLIVVEWKRFRKLLNKS